jgi:hypothetical protein
VIKKFKNQVSLTEETACLLQGIYIIVLSKVVFFLTLINILNVLLETAAFGTSQFKFFDKLLV